MNTYERLIDKAKEAFVMSIEIYNKPSIYHCKADGNGKK